MPAAEKKASEPNPAKQVFVSHSSADGEAAAELAEQLEARGVSCWIAPRDVKPGTNYAGAIIEGIETCDTLALLVSKAANDSEHVQRELERAVDAGKRIIPVRLEDLEPTKGMSYFLAGVQRMDAFGKGNGGGLAAAAAGIAITLGSRIQPVPSPPKRLSPRKMVVALIGVLATTVIVFAIVLHDDAPHDPLAPARRLMAEGQIFAAGEAAQAVATTTPANQEAQTILQKVAAILAILGSKTASELRAIPNSFNLKLWTEDGSSRFSIGKEIPLRIEAEVDCHIVVISHISDGSEMILYPNRDYKETLLRAGEVRFVPGPSLQLKAAPPKGMDVIYALAAPKESTLKRLISEVKEALETQDVRAGPYVAYEASKAPSKRGFVIEPTEAASARVIAVETVD